MCFLGTDSCKTRNHFHEVIFFLTLKSPLLSLVHKRSRLNIGGFMKLIFFVTVFATVLTAQANVNEIGRGSIFELKTDLTLKQDGSMVYPGIRAKVLSGARAIRRGESEMGWNHEEHSYTSLHCELHAKKTELKKDMLLKKGLKLKVKRALSSRTENEYFYEDDEVMWTLIKRYLSKHGEDHVFADITFDHPAIDKLMCVVPNNQDAEVPIWFLEQSVGNVFDITILKDIEIYQ